MGPEESPSALLGGYSHNGVSPAKRPVLMTPSAKRPGVTVMALLCWLPVLVSDAIGQDRVDRPPVYPTAGLPSGLDDRLAWPNWSCNDASRESAASTILDPVSNQIGNGEVESRGSIEAAIARLPRTGSRILYLRTGHYRLTEPLVLTANDRGLVISACPGERPVLEGPPDSPVVVLRGAREVVLTGLIFSGPSSVHLVTEGTDDCVITSNTFLRGGTTILMTGSSRNVIQGNQILQSTATGIELRDGSNGNLLADNIIDGAGATETNGGGIFLHGTSHNRISHNLIRNTAGFGVGILNWDDMTINVANVIEYNVILNTTLTAEDSGAIYILGRSGADTQVVIAGNIVDGVGSPARHNVGIYLDDSSNGAMVTGNLVRRVGSDAVEIHGGSDNVIENNIFDLGEGQPSAVLFQAAPADTNPLNAQIGNEVVRNVILSANKDPKIFVFYDGGTPKIAGNLYANATGRQTLPSEDVTDSAPILVSPDHAQDAGRNDYRKVLNRAAETIGFRRIDFRLAGPRVSYWAAPPVTLPQRQ